MAINTNIGSSLLTFNFRDDEDNIVASFRMNPADVKLAQRCQEASAFFEELKENTPENATLEDAIKFNDMIEEKICGLLGYDARPTLFSEISATSLLADGDMFATVILQKITEVVGPELKKRQSKMDKAMAKHTKKYTK